MAEFRFLSDAQVKAVAATLSIDLNIAQQSSILRAVDELFGALSVASPLDTRLDAAETAITNINAWGAALATKLNADAGVTDADYDTTVQ